MIHLEKTGLWYYLRIITYSFLIDFICFLGVGKSSMIKYNCELLSRSVENYLSQCFIGVKR